MDDFVIVISCFRLLIYQRLDLRYFLNIADSMSALTILRYIQPFF